MIKIKIIKNGKTETIEGESYVVCVLQKEEDDIHSHADVTGTMPDLCFLIDSVVGGMIENSPPAIKAAIVMTILSGMLDKFPAIVDTSEFQMLLDGIKNKGKGS